MKPAQAKSSCAARWRRKKAKSSRTNVVITEIPYTMIGANIGKFLSDVRSACGEQKDDGYRGYFKPVVQRGHPDCDRTQKDADVDHFISMLYKRHVWKIPLA